MAPAGLFFLVSLWSQMEEFPSGIPVKWQREVGSWLSGGFEAHVGHSHCPFVPFVTLRVASRLPGGHICLTIWPGFRLMRVSRCHFSHFSHPRQLLLAQPVSPPTPGGGHVLLVTPAQPGHLEESAQLRVPIQNRCPLALPAPGKSKSAKRRQHSLTSTELCDPQSTA